ncbi:MAG: DOMON domain-containing protein [bacterium]
MMRLLVSVALLAGALAAADDMPVMSYDPELDDRASSDGWVEREEGEFEYPAQFVNAATGMTVSWGYDDSLMYVGVETRGRGWFGIGFGSATMDGANMVVGFDTDDTTDAFCLVGKGHAHPVAGSADLLLPDWDIDFDDETGITTMEFAYPLTWRGEGAPAQFAGNEVLKGAAVSGLVPGETYDLILAQNTKTFSLDAKHTHFASLKFRMGDKPEPEPEPDPAPAPAPGTGK